MDHTISSNGPLPKVTGENVFIYHFVLKAPGVDSSM